VEKLEELENERIIELVREFCFDYRPAYTYSHEEFQGDLTDFLRENGCQVINEYELVFDNVKENGDIVQRRDFIDFLVFLNQKKIAIEFDNGNNLKLKSISKLLQSEADVIIGIVRGNQRYNVWYSNKRRMIRVMKSLQILRRPILLIINSQKSASWIDALYRRRGPFFM